VFLAAELERRREGALREARAAEEALVQQSSPQAISQMGIGKALRATGRPAGALGWAGLANLFYWMDRRNGFGGFWATQILPFGDPVSFVGYMDFETAFYTSLRQKQVP
jgi:methyl acetate hydrolase